MLGNRLKNLLAQKKMSQAELARRIGISPMRVSEWVNDKIDPGTRMIREITRILEISASELIDDTSNIKEAIVSIPILGTVPAGNPVEAVEYHEGSLPIPQELTKRVDFGLRVKGTSMIGASILDGDIVLVKQTSDVLNKQIVVATMDGEATVKRFYKNGDSIILKPENNDFEPILVSPLSDFRLVGLVTGLWRQEIR